MSGAAVAPAFAAVAADTRYCTRTGAALIAWARTNAGTPCIVVGDVLAPSAEPYQPRLTRCPGSLSASTPGSFFASVAVVHGPIGETLHAEPASDPNEYTKSKRRTEWMVATSGIPYQIHRPSVVVGHSRDGRYSGKPYGAYQIWTGLCRFFSDRPRRELQIVAPDVPLNLVHQDAVQAGFHAAFRSLPAGTIIHLVSRPATTPTTREFWHFWVERCGRPDTVFYYDQLHDVDREALDERARLLVDFAECNIEISSHDWQFETGTLDALRRAGLTYTDATRASSSIAFDWFLSRNTDAQAFLAAHGAELEGRRPQVIHVPRGMRRHPVAAMDIDTAARAPEHVEAAARP